MSTQVHPGRILIDADACPVKEEIYRVAFRRDVPVKVVSNSRIRVPDHPLVERVLVSDAFDAADDWIAEEAGANDVVVTGDILLADRCLKAGATVLGHNGKPFTSASIGTAIATRAIMADLRAGGDVVGGPAPFAKTDRSRFLQALDEALVRLGARRLRPLNGRGKSQKSHCIARAPARARAREGCSGRAGEAAKAAAASLIASLSRRNPAPARIRTGERRCPRPLSAGPTRGRAALPLRAGIFSLDASRDRGRSPRPHTRYRHIPGSPSSFRSLVDVDGPWQNWVDRRPAGRLVLAAISGRCQSRTCQHRESVRHRHGSCRNPRFVGSIIAVADPPRSCGRGRPAE